MKLLLIINPISGTRTLTEKQELAAKITSYHQAQGNSVDVVLTQHAGHGAELARNAAKQGYQGVMALGGDGTVNEIASALVGTNVALGILPSGSGNGLARHIALNMDPFEAAKIVSEANIQDCDYVTMNNRPFFCTFGMGFDADVAMGFAQAGTRGLLTYVQQAFKKFVNFKTETLELTLDGNPPIQRKAFLVAICNASQYGNNAYIAPKASVTDGLMDVVIVRKSSRLRTLLVGIDLMSGLLDDNRLIETHRCKHCTIKRLSVIEQHHDTAPTHLDGEPLQAPTTLEFKLHHGKLKLFTPPDKQPFRPLITPATSW